MSVNLPSNWSNSQSQSYRQSVGQSVSLWGTHLGPATNFSPFFCINNCGFLDVERPLWREDRSVIYCTIASGPCQSSHSRVQVPQNSGHILRPDLRLPQPGGPGPRIYIPQEQGGSVIPPGTGFPFRRLLRLAGLRWRYCNQPPHGVVTGSQREFSIMGVSVKPEHHCV
jgi:hypothetical protein